MRIRFVNSLFLLLPAALLTVGAVARAGDDPLGFVQRETQKLSGLLHQPKGSGRDAQVQQELDAMVDYDELTRRAFGQPCPASESGCTNDWTTLTPAQQSEVGGLLKRLIQKNYQKNLEKTLDYDIAYKGEKATDAGDTKIRTEAKSKANARDPAVQVDYLVRERNGKLFVVDIVTEGASLTKTYYDQFDKKLKDPAQGYGSIVQKLRDKIGAT
jgi:phospholipid transport system substrate-binding protein